MARTRTLTSPTQHCNWILANAKVQGKNNNDKKKNLIFFIVVIIFYMKILNNVFTELIKQCRKAPENIYKIDWNHTIYTLMMNNWKLKFKK